MDEPDKCLMQIRIEDLERRHAEDNVPFRILGTQRAQLMTDERIRSGLERDEERGTYTFFDYIVRAMRMPNDLLVQHTDIESIDKRREVARFMTFPPAVPKSRVWKKVRYTDEL